MITSLKTIRKNYNLIHANVTVVDRDKQNLEALCRNTHEHLQCRFIIIIGV